MFGAGHLGDSIHLRKFLTFGMLASGAMVCSVGLAYFLDIHSIWYFVVVQVIGGALPSLHSFIYLPASTSAQEKEAEMKRVGIYFGLHVHWALKEWQA